MILKLQPDAPVQLRVLAITDDVSQSSGLPQYKLAGRTSDEGDVILFLSASNAERQFALCKLTRDSIIGRTVQFTKRKKGAQQFIDMALPGGTPAPAASKPSNGNGAVASTAAPPARSIPPAAPLKGQAQIDQERKDLSARFFSLHRACVQHVLTSDTNALKVAGLADTAETATARINTLFDTACREGLAK